MSQRPNNESVNRDDVEALILGHFEGNLDAKQEQQLAAAISTSTESKTLFLSHMRMEGRLHSLGYDGFLSEENTQTSGNQKLGKSVIRALQSGPEAPLQPATPSLRIKRPKHLPRSRVWVASSSVAVCCILIAIVCWGLWPSPVNADSVLQKAQRAAAEPIDRTYRITISRSVDQTRTRELMMSLGGEGRFVIQPVDGAYVMGHDGSEFWVTQRNGPVWVTSDFQNIVSKLRGRIPERRLLELVTSPDEPLSLAISELLSLIERQYEMELVETKTVKEYRIRAMAKSNRANYPDVIDLWSDVDSGVVLRIEAKFANGRQRQFELIETAKLSETWYHYSEHTSGKQVERMDTTN